VTNETPLSEYLVLSRGHWDESRTPEDIQGAIDSFYAWHARLVDEGRMKPGRRLAREGRVVMPRNVVDGPFTEAKEIIGGYWFIVARDLDEAARTAAENPCLAFGLYYEIRPIDEAQASAFVDSSETPDGRRG
jgi:hypothetical protein